MTSKSTESNNLLNKLISLEVPATLNPSLRADLLNVIDRAVYELETSCDESDIRFAASTIRVFQAIVKDSTMIEQ